MSSGGPFTSDRINVLRARESEGRLLILTEVVLSRARYPTRIRGSTQHETTWARWEGLAR